MSSYVRTVCKNLKVKERWEVVDPVARKGGLLLFWGTNITVCQIVKSDFCMEVEIEGQDFVGRWW